MNRRRVLAGIGGTAVAGLGAGLYLFKDELTAHSSSPISVESAVLEETGYQESGVESVVVEREVATQDVVVTNYMTEYEKTVDMGPLGEQRGAVFVALTTPQVRILGKEFNPVEGMSTDDLVELVQGNYDGIENVSHDADEDVTVLEQTTTQARYTAQATFDGASVDVDLLVTEAVETDDDLVVTIGVYPQLVRGRERENVRDLVGGIVDESPSGFDESNSGPEDGDDGDENDADGNGANGDGGDGNGESGDGEDDSILSV